MTNFIRHATALAFTTLASALLLVGAVGSASQSTPVASSARLVA